MRHASAKTVYCLCLLPFFVAACGGDNDITGPSNRIPEVAGNYRGTTTIVFPEIPRTVTCSTTTSVTQSGSTVSIAPLQLTGADCAGLSVPVGSATIDATGSLGQESGSITQACGTYNFVGSGGFFGRDLRLSLAYTSRTCFNMNITINMSRS